MIYDDIVSKKSKISVVGLGYVGLPLAVAFSRKADVIGFDADKTKIEKFSQGTDITGEVGSRELACSGVCFTSDETRLKEAVFHIIAVPTPVKEDRTPDMGAIIAASETVGRNLRPGAYVVYESTVYPGATEEICIPLLEKNSGLHAGRDFKVGYSPERINPGDKEHRVRDIKKIVSGIDAQACDVIGDVYELAIEAGVYRAADIRTAEAAKVIENAQRDINIAFINEISIIMNALGVDTLPVLEAAKSKWNFLDFAPGLVGGHCIGVDPYYLIYKAQQAGVYPRLMLAGRHVNEYMSAFISENVVKQLIIAGEAPKNAVVAVLGATFKENCPDIRNSGAVKIYRELERFGINPVICDPIADPEEMKREYGIELKNIQDIKNASCIVIAVAHDEYKKLGSDDFAYMLKENGMIFDVKGTAHKRDCEERGFSVWRL